MRHIQVVYIGRAQPAPEFGQQLKRLQALHRTPSQKRSVDGAGRCADEYLERETSPPSRALAQHPRQRAQYTDLVRRACAAAHEHQCNCRTPVLAQAGVNDGVEAHLHIL